MVAFEVPPLTEDLMEMIQDQKDALDNLFAQGKLLSYSFTMDTS